VYAGNLPFDRTIKVSLTENLTKEQIQARMPHNFRTIDHLVREKEKDFTILINKNASEADRKAARLRFLSRRKKLTVLIEELSLRSRRISPLIQELQKFSDRVEFLQEQMNNPELSAVEKRRFKSEYIRLLRLVCNNVSAIVSDSSNSSKKPSVNSQAVTCGWLFRSPRSTAIAG